jgi:BolA family transcriptional regulator, general stress-responsive regulator
MTLQTLIEQRLQATFSPSSLSVLDESHEHSGHAGAVGGGQHFAVAMTVSQFTGLNAVKRHQLVYGALHDFMQDKPAVSSDVRHSLGYIHALKLQLQG